MIQLKIIKRTHNLLNLGAKNIKKHLFSSIFIVGLITIIGFTITSQAKNNTTDSDSYYTNFQSKIDASMGQDPNLTNTYDNPTLSTNMLNVNGPLQVSLAWSDVYGAMLQTHYANLLSDRNAIAIEGNLGAMQNRINVTLGHVFSPKNRIKITAERLSQKQTFDFYSGSIDEWVSQYAGGAELQHLIGGGFFNNVSAGGYYARSGSKSLDPIIYTDATGTEWINYRHIAGANSTGGHISFGLKPWKTGMLTLTSYYDSVSYNTEYTDISAEDSSSLGYGVALEQYISNALKATAEYSHRALYDTIQGSIQWFHNIRHNKAAIGMSLGYSHNNYNDTTGDNDSENMYTVGMQYYFMPIKNGYTMPRFNFQSLTAWTSEPAVRMEKVMAAADQENKSINITWNSKVTETRLPDDHDRLISWFNNATSNVPNADMKYTLTIHHQTGSKAVKDYSEDVTGLSSKTITDLTPGDTYTVTITVVDTVSKKSSSGQTTFTAGSDQVSYPWDPDIQPSTSKNYPQNAIILQWTSPTREYDTQQYSSTVDYTVTLTNPNDSNDTHTYELKGDNTPAGGKIKLDTYAISHEANLQAGITYHIHMDVEDNNHNDSIEVTNNTYTCTTEGTRKEIDWDPNAVTISASKDPDNPGYHKVDVNWDDHPATLSDAGTTNDTIKYSYIVKPQYCYYDHNDDGSKTKVCMNNNQTQSGVTSGTHPSIKDIKDNDGQYSSHFLNKITALKVEAKAYNGDTEDTSYPSKTINNTVWLNPDYN